MFHNMSPKYQVRCVMNPLYAVINCEWSRDQGWGGGGGGGSDLPGVFFADKMVVMGQATRGGRFKVVIENGKVIR